jgi:hypothetical protein
LKVFARVSEESCIVYVYNLLEQLIECGSRVLGLGDRSGSFALDGLARLEKRALVAQVFLWDPFGDRLAALEARAGIKAHTVFAGMKVAVALRALGIQRDASYLHVNEGPAQRASGNFAESGHLWGTYVASLLRWARLLLLFFFVLIAALFVFSIH